MLSKLYQGFAQFIQAVQAAQTKRAEFYVKHYGSNGGWEWFKN